MATEKRHRCGGALVPREVQLVLEESSSISIVYSVDGFVCDKCNEELIDRETALQIQASQTPTVAWHPAAGIGTTEIDAINFRPLTATLSEALAR